MKKINSSNDYFLTMQAQDHRIYVIVPKTVQTHLCPEWIKPGELYLLRPTSRTVSIPQPAGRIAAQCAHVTSRMRMRRMLKISPQYENSQAFAEQLSDESITTIILSVEDSFQLDFYQRLLYEDGFKLTEFFDTNEEYGVCSVRTAICTEPVRKEDAQKILGYLPLWDGL